MRTVYHPVLKRDVSAIGFGCASLGSRISPSEGIRALGEAYQLGVNWFDVAPPYGDGQAEAILGSFLKGRRDEAVICTKVGIARPEISAIKRLLRSPARWAVQAFPGLRKQISRARSVGSRPPLEPATLRMSVEASLRLLKTDYIDVLALHEPTVEDCTNPLVIETLTDLCKEGLARTISIAGSHDSILAGIRASAIFSGAQFPNNPFSNNVDAMRQNAPPDRVFLVTHGVFDPEASKRLGQILLDKSDRPQIDRSPAQLLMDYALAKNPAGTVVLSMYSSHHIVENCAKASQELDLKVSACGGRTHFVKQRQTNMTGALNGQTRASDMTDLAVIILTYNESIHLERALKHIKHLAKEIFVIDSFSTDNTVEIAKTHGATVLQNRFVNYAKQFQWALANAPITSTWVMRLDADEIIEPDLAAEIASKLPALPIEITGINLRRKLVFMNRTISYGGRGILVLLRIWRHGYGEIEDRWMDEHMIVREGRTITFVGGFSDHNLNNLTFFIEKHNKYATREAIDALNQRLRFMPMPASLSVERSSLQAAMKRYIKEEIYNRIPFQISACAYFLYRYVVSLGFLDGREGLIYHVLQGFWYRFLVGAKLSELQVAISHLTKLEDIREELQRVTGLTLSSTSTSEVSSQISTSGLLSIERS
ncbi:aryl-alcohol dehydrogenase-like predicted oxidoreductase/glycosyltransferase involved in cell wall biosynthesis [Bradyrhizobium sp. GM7.3]